MSVLKQMILCALVVALGAAGWFLYQNPQMLSAARESPETAGERPAGGQSRANRIPGLPGASGAINVITGPVVVEDGGETATALGTAMAVRSVTIIPQVAGVVEEVLFTPGETVEEGDLLVRLEDDQQAVAVERARIAAADADAALERARALAESRTITKVALSEAETAAQVAGIELRTAEIELSRRAIVAPFSGTTGLSDISVGEVVGTSTEIVTLDDLSTIRVGFEVPERRAVQIEQGQAVAAVAQGMPGSKFPGEITAIDSRVDEATRTLRMEASLRNDEQRLKPGMALTVAIPFDTPGELAVPSLAVQWDRDGSYVWKVLEGAVERAEVAIVRRQSGTVTVTGELQADDRVVMEGVQRLREGAQVVDVATVPAGANSAAPTDAGGAPAVSDARQPDARS